MTPETPRTPPDPGLLAVRSLVAALPWPAAYVAADLRFESASAAWAERVGDRDPLGLELDGAGPPVTLGALVERARDGGRVVERAGAGSVVEAHPLQTDGGPAGVLVVLRDADAPATEAADAAGALAASEAAARLLGDYLRHAVAEVRTPLSAVSGFSELLRATALDERQAGLVRRVRQSAVHLARLVDDLGARVDAAPTAAAPARVDVGAAVRAGLRRAVREGEQTALALGPDVPRWVEADADGLRLGLRRVVEAVLAEHRPGDEVAVDVAWSDGVLRVAVDPGSDRPVSSVARWVAADEAARALGGALWFDGARGAATLEVPAPRASPADDVDLHGLRLLVVGEDGPDRALAVGRAEALGMSVVAVATDREARGALCGLDRIDLAFVAAELPDGSGLGLARLLRARHPPRALPIVVHGAAEAEADVPGVVVCTDRGPTSAERFAALLREAANRSGGTEPAAPPRVLVVEDDPVNQALVLDMARALGVEADLAGDGAEALARMAAFRYDVVLMDVMLPDRDGMDVTRQVRRELGESPRIVALTALASDGDRRRCLASGMNGFLAKPYRLAQLAEALGVRAVA